MAILITCVEKDALDIYNGLPFETDEGRTDIYHHYIDADGNTLCRRNECHIYERYVFSNRMQETYARNIYATALRSLAKPCDFVIMKDDLIRDRIVCGIRDNVMRKRLLQVSSLTLHNCMDICRAVELTDG